MRRTAWALVALLIALAGCGGGTDGTPAAPPTAPAPTPPPAPEPEPPPEPPIEITPVGRGISVTSENQILLELMPEDVVPANPLDLAGRTLVFTPAGSGYSREVRDLTWDEDLGDPVDDNTEIVFSFDFAGREWGSFFVSRYGVVTFGEPYPFSQHGPDRWGTMTEIAEHLGAPPMIAALYKPRLGGWSVYDAEQRFRNTQHVSRRPDRVVVTWITTDPAFHVHGVPPQEKTRFQLTLHSDGRIAFHYAPEPADPDEAIRDGIVGLFPTADSSPELYEVFHYTGTKDHLVSIGCRIIETLGDEFDAFVFHGQFRYDLQFSGSWWGYYPGNQPIRGIGFPESLDERKSPCGVRLRGQWGFAIWTQSDFVAIPDGDGGLAPGPEGTWHLAHEFTHTWTASASYLRDGEIEPLAVDAGHWLPELHTPSAFVRAGSIMGGDFWNENADRTFTRVLGQTKEEHGLSWLDLYLMGLATADEMTDTFLLRSLRETGDGWRGPHTADKETVTAEQILDALGPRDPPAAQSQKVFNMGFVYLLEPGQDPDQDQLRFHALFLDGALEYWARITGGRSRLTTELPPG